MNRRDSIASVLATAVAFGIIGATPALAEGSWTSSISNANSGFLSRVWTDRNSDDASTTIYFGGCDRPTITLGLFRQVFGLDPNLGNKAVCSDRTANWGDVPAGDYRFKIMNQATDVDVEVVRVRY